MFIRPGNKTVNSGSSGETNNKIDAHLNMCISLNIKEMCNLKSDYPDIQPVTLAASSGKHLCARMSVSYFCIFLQLMWLLKYTQS